MRDAAAGAAFAVLGPDTVEKIRTAVYKRVAASYMEGCLQADLLERFGTANESFLRDIWGGIDIEAGCGVINTKRYEPFHEAAYQEDLRTMDADHATATEYEAKKRQPRAAEPTTE
jgi:hypothetical protein